MELIETQLRSPRPAEGYYTSQLEARAWPVRTFLPAGYEPRYPYPLVVFLHGQGGNEEQILRLAPRLSRRNFISIGLRGPVSLGIRHEGPGFGWGDGKHATLVEDYLLAAVAHTRRQYHVHSERVYLAGFAEGAAMAYRLALRFGDQLAGVIALNGAMPRVQRPLFDLPRIRALRVFIAHGIANSIIPWSMAQEDFHLLRNAGLQAVMHSYPTTQQLHPHMLRDLNRWIVENCTAETFA